MTPPTAGPSYGFPALVAVIFGLTASCILAGGVSCIVGLFIGLPLLAVVCGVYAMYIMPRVAGLVPPLPKPDPKIRAHYQLRAALRGLIIGCIAVAFVWLAMQLTSNNITSTSDDDPGEPLPVVLLAGPIAAVFAFFLARHSQLRGIEQWQRFYGTGDTDENQPADDPGRDEEVTGSVPVSKTQRKNTG